jgi:hypothetical protein
MDPAGANCAAIEFDLPGAGPWTITLASALPTINRDLTITGPGRDLLTISGADAYRPFNITGGTVTIEALTAADGRSGFQTISGNGVRIVVAVVTLRGMGIGIAPENDAHTVDVTIVDSLIENNRASDGEGGGLYVTSEDYPEGGTATVAVINTTISGNVAGAGGSGAYITSGSGGSTTVTFTNSTISGNALNNRSFNGGLEVFNGVFEGTTNVALRYSTVTGNEGIGLTNNGGTLSVLGSIVAGAVPDPDGTDIVADCEALSPITSLGHNLWGDATDCPDNAAAGDQNLDDLGLTIGDVLDTTLADNGGPTPTHALVAQSPAIDQGDDEECPGIDQRGFARPAGAGCDVGAYEAGAGAPPSPSPSPSPSPGTCDSPFADVPDDHEACAAIAALADRGVANGYTPQGCEAAGLDFPCYGPRDDVERAQVAAFLVRALDWEGRPTGPRSFDDFDGLVGELITASLVLANACADPNDPATCVAQGYGDGRFGPTDQVSYAQVIAFIARAFDLDAGYDWAPQPNGA